MYTRASDVDWPANSCIFTTCRYNESSDWPIGLLHIRTYQVSALRRNPRVPSHFSAQQMCFHIWWPPAEILWTIRPRRAWENSLGVKRTTPPFSVTRQCRFYQDTPQLLHNYLDVFHAFKLDPLTVFSCDCKLVGVQGDSSSANIETLGSTVLSPFEKKRKREKWWSQFSIHFFK